MDHAAARDIELVERLGYTRNEAIDLVIRRALVADREIVDERSEVATADRRAYLDELRDICLAGTC